MGWSNIQSLIENEGELEVGATLPGQELTDKDKFPYPMFDVNTWELKKYFDESIKLARIHGPVYLLQNDIRKRIWLHGKLTGSRLHGTGNHHYHRENLKEHQESIIRMAPDNCPMCGRKLNYWQGKNKNTANPENPYFDEMHLASIDRINNEEPYQLWDILIICNPCNMDWKRDWVFPSWLVYELRMYGERQRNSEIFIPMPEALRQACWNEFGKPKWTLTS